MTLVDLISWAEENLAQAKELVAMHKKLRDDSEARMKHSEAGISAWETLLNILREMQTQDGDPSSHE